jgi:hypothetical protein
MINKTRGIFAFLPVSQVRTNTFFIVYFLDNLLTDATSGAVTACPSGAPEFTPGL